MEAEVTEQKKMGEKVSFVLFSFQLAVLASSFSLSVSN
jgi:hypothetical protein